MSFALVESWLHWFRVLRRMTAMRNAAVLTAGFAVILMACWFVTFWLVAAETRKVVRQALTRDLESVISIWGESGALPPPATRDTFYLRRGADGTFQTTGIPFPGARRRVWRDGFETVRPRHPAFRRGSGAAVRLLSREVDGARFMVGQVEGTGEVILETVNAGFFGAAILTVLGLGAFSFGAAWRTQRRMLAIERALGRIRSGDLEARLPEAGQDDDLGRVSAAINATAADLEQVMLRLKVQSANIAHDLKTPLAGLRASLEVQALAGRSDPAEAERALVMADRIISIFDALLRIAKIESGARRAAFRDLALEDVGKRAAEVLGPVVEDRGFVFEVRVMPGGVLPGDGDLLFQAVANLVQNAMNHAPVGSVVRLEAGPGRLAVVDWGPGIPFDKRDEVVLPLRQLDEVRSGEGVGLGLSMVKAIAELHGARLVLADTDPEKARGLTAAMVW